MITIERVLQHDGTVALWSADENGRQFLGIEQTVRPSESARNAPYAVCWSHGRTIGNVELFNPDVLAAFPDERGEDIVIGCDIVEAGKMRNGARRWWCRTHQVHWGTKADLAAAHSSGNLCCSNRSQPMSFVITPPIIRPDDHAEVGVWCSMPPAITSTGVPLRRRPKIHAHARNVVGGEKMLDGLVDALSVQYRALGDLFGGSEDITVNVTPPAAFEFVTALETGRALGYIACKYCGSPHLDIGEFGRIAHTKHLCGNCGRDSIRSSEPLISTPLKPLYDRFIRDASFRDVDRTLNLDDFGDASFAVWASTPALLWTANRPQKRGIHVHLSINGRRVIDDTFGSIVYRGEELRRADLLTKMIENTLL